MAERFVEMARAAQIPPGKMKRVVVDGRAFVVANVGGTFCVADDACTHEEASLAGGALHGEVVRCPLHGARFNLRTGQALEEPAEKDLRIYPARLEGGCVLALLDPQQRP